MEEPAWSDNRYPPIDYQDLSYYSAPKAVEKKQSLDEVRPSAWPAGRAAPPQWPLFCMASWTWRHHSGRCSAWPAGRGATTAARLLLRVAAVFGAQASSLACAPHGCHRAVPEARACAVHQPKRHHKAPLEGRLGLSTPLMCSLAIFTSQARPPLPLMAQVDPELLATFDKLGIPLNEQKRLANVAVDAVFDSVSIATTFKAELAKARDGFCFVGVYI